ncbi:MAG: hypothetical protein U9R58_13565 [Chloroflexota bacterium]|nr:hypothetical protein [Chloroflexota bacterium]
MTKKMYERDWEALSAYSDGQLSSSESARLESRLPESGELRAALDELRKTSDLLRSQPKLRAPRNFILTPDMVGLRQQAPAYPALRLAAVLASILFIFVLVGDLYISNTSMQAAQIARSPAAEMAVEAPEDLFLDEEPAPQMFGEPEDSQVTGGGKAVVETTEAEEELVVESEAQAVQGTAFPPTSTSVEASAEAAALETKELMEETSALLVAPTGTISEAAPAFGDDDTALPLQPTHTVVERVEASPSTLLGEALPGQKSAQLPTEHPTKGADILPTPTTQLMTTPESAADSQWLSGISTLRWLEIGLAALAIIAGAAALILRRR